MQHGREGVGVIVRPAAVSDHRDDVGVLISAKRVGHRIEYRPGSRLHEQSGGGTIVRGCVGGQWRGERLIPHQRRIAEHFGVPKVASRRGVHEFLSVAGQNEPIAVVFEAVLARGFIRCAVVRRAFVRIRRDQQRGGSTHRPPPGSHVAPKSLNGCAGDNQNAECQHDREDDPGDDRPDGGNHGGRRDPSHDAAGGVHRRCTIGRCGRGAREVPDANDAGDDGGTPDHQAPGGGVLIRMAEESPRQREKTERRDPRQCTEDRRRDGS